MRGERRTGHRYACRLPPGLQQHHKIIVQKNNVPMKVAMPKDAVIICPKKLDTVFT
jgi:hypothetical protein